MSSISPVPKTPWPVSKVQNWLLLLVGVKTPAAPLNSSLQTGLPQFVCALAAEASSNNAAPSNSKYRHAVDADFPIWERRQAPKLFDAGLPWFQVTSDVIMAVCSSEIWLCSVCWF